MCESVSLRDIEPEPIQSLQDLRDATDRISAQTDKLAVALAGIREEWDDEALGASLAFAQADGWRVGMLNSEGHMEPFDDGMGSDCSGVCHTAARSGSIEGTVSLGSGIVVQCRGVALGGSGSVLCGERMAMPVLQSSELSDGPDVEGAL